jgi:thiosulfate/3-mercaptopyruvate sulfurtransferase
MSITKVPFKLFSLGVFIILASQMATAADEYFVSAEEAQKLPPDSVRFVFADSAKEFEAGHIPNSVEAFAHDLNYLDDVNKCKGLPMCEPTAAAFIGKTLGIDAKTKVIVYDNGMGVNASGVWFFLTLYGHPDVKILDGGMAAWKDKKFAVETGHGAKVAEKSFTPSVKTDMFVVRDEVEKATKDAGNYLILDSRHNLDEYTGKQLLSGLTSPGKEATVSRGGFIPTAVFSPWKKYAGNPNAEAGKTTLKSADDIKKQLEKLKKNGYDEKKTVITYCHVGLGRGSFQYMALKRAGHKNTKLYVGSWQDWGNSTLPLGKQE